MYKTYIAYNIEAEFKNFLEQNKYSRISIRNYLVDMRKFLSWISFTLQSQGLSFEMQYVTSDAIERYMQYMKGEKFPSASINRQLSTLRLFTKFCLLKGYLSTNPLQDFNNIKQGQYENVVKRSYKWGPNLFVGIIGFLVIFILFSIPAAYIFRLGKIGKLNLSLPGDQLPASNNSINSAIASTSADLLTIPILDERGNLNLTAPYPRIIGHNGTLTISAPDIALDVKKTGNISLQSDEGTIQFLFGGKEPSLPFDSAFYFAANEMESGTLLYAQTKNDDASIRLLELASGQPAEPKFTVDSDGNVHIYGNLVLEGNLIASPQSIIFGSVSTDTATSSASPEAR